MDHPMRTKSPAAKSAAKPPWTENAKTCESSSTRKQALRSAPKLIRTTIRTSRTMDYFSEKELVTQTGHDVSEWSLVFVKEVVDNALDACEEASVAPIIDIKADSAG